MKGKLMKKLSYFIHEMKKLPNLITSVRIILLPALVYFAYTKNLLLFTIFFYICALSDQIDGIVARKLNMCSKFGSNLDSFADELYLFFALIFLYLMKPEIFLSCFWQIVILFVFLVADRFIIYPIKFKGCEKLHTYAGKFFQRYFLVTFPLILAFDFYYILFLILFLLGTIAASEEILIYLTHDKIDSKIMSFVKKELNPFYYLLKLWP
jgi:phosphatidylglycerophosphate synthase